MKNKIIICAEPYDIGLNMKGMGYRYWNLALFLSGLGIDVDIIVNDVDTKWGTGRITFIKKSDYKKHIKGNNKYSHTIVHLETSDELIESLKDYGCKLIFDNILTPFESFFFQKNIISGIHTQIKEVLNRTKKLKRLIKISDFYVCGTYEEKFETIGQIMFAKKMTENEIYKMANKICVIHTPFISKNMDGYVNDEVHINTDNTFLWNGGLWNHYKLDFLVEAFKKVNEISEELIVMKFMYRNNTSLYDYIKKESEKYNFIDVPNSFQDNSKYSLRKKDKILHNSRAIILLNDHTIQGELVLPLRMRESLLYIKPMIVSDFGILARYVKINNIGIVVTNTEEDLYKAISEMMDDKKYQFYCDNIKRMRQDFLIENNAINLIKYIKHV